MNRPSTRAIAAIGGAGVIVAIVLVALLLRDQAAGPPGADASGTPAASATTTASPATPGEPQPSTPSATGSPPAVVPEEWTAVATFSEAGKRYVLGDMVEWADGLIAVGTLYEEESRNVFGPPPPRSGRVWRSPDGTVWTDATPANTFADVELAHLFETADGALIAIGNTYPEVDAVSQAWGTTDGETWTPIELDGVPAGSFVLQVASGAQGHVASTYVGAAAHPLFSADGRTWQPTLHDDVVTMVAAGDEGFVASTFGGEPGGTSPQVVASADGLEWFDATEPDGERLLAASRGGDWIATTTAVADGSVSVATWGSANGLDWSVLGEMALQDIEISGTSCAEVPAILHGLPTLTVAGTVLGVGLCGEGAVVSAGASYASLDGVSWTRLPFGDQAFAAGAAETSDRIVIATDARTNQADVVGVSFWISQSP